MPEKTAEDGLKSKNARKQIHSKIQFYMGIHVTSFDFRHFLLRWSKSTCPTANAVPIQFDMLGIEWQL